MSARQLERAMWIFAVALLVVVIVVAANYGDGLSLPSGGGTTSATYY